eukprot:g41308.t1
MLERKISQAQQYKMKGVISGKKPKYVSAAHPEWPPRPSLFLAEEVGALPLPPRTRVLSPNTDLVRLITLLEELSQRLGKLEEMLYKLRAEEQLQSNLQSRVEELEGKFAALHENSLGVHF